MRGALTHPPGSAVPDRPGTEFHLILDINRYTWPINLNLNLNLNLPSNLIGQRLPALGLVPIPNQSTYPKRQRLPALS